MIFCDIVDLKWFFISFSFENERSPERLVTIKHRKIHSAISVFVNCERNAKTVINDKAIQLNINLVADGIIVYNNIMLQLVTELQRTKLLWYSWMINKFH